MAFANGYNSLKKLKRAQRWPTETDIRNELKERKTK